jgi:hypothetical protein
MMYDNYVGPNLRGTAIRSADKRVRVGTHLPVLRLAIDTMKPRIVVELGMGLSSTPFLHEHVPSFISLEDDERWATCSSCKEGTSEHRVMSFREFIASPRPFGDDPANTLLFLDGPDQQRKELLALAVEAGVPVIVEHDADSFEPERVDFIGLVTGANGYAVHQYVGQNPETLLITKADHRIDLPTDAFVKWGTP